MEAELCTQCGHPEKDHDYVQHVLGACAKFVRGVGMKHEIERLRKTLEFYANPEIYKPHPHGPAFDRRDLSFHAKEALATDMAVTSEWWPISEADKGIAYIHDMGGLRIGNSYPIWARDAGGRVFECLWADDGKRAYWWDIEGESPVDPVEFMPHPLAKAYPPTAETPTH